MAVSNGCEKFAPDVAVGESGPAERREVRHGGKIFGDVSGVNKDHHIDERGVQSGVKEGSEFHGVDCDRFIAKSAEGGETAADVEWEGGEARGPYANGGVGPAGQVEEGDRSVAAMGNAFAAADRAIGEDDYVLSGARGYWRVGEGLGEGAKWLRDEGGKKGEWSDRGGKVSVLGDEFLAEDGRDVIGEEGKPGDFFIPRGGGAEWWEV